MKRNRIQVVQTVVFRPSWPAKDKRTSLWQIGFFLALCTTLSLELYAQEIVGVNVVPHQFSSNLKWRQAPDPELGARVELFLQNKTLSGVSLKPDALRFDSQPALALLKSNDWTWHNTNHSHDIELPSESMTVIQFNGRRSTWGVDSQHELSISTDKMQKLPFALNAPKVWIDLVSFHRDSNAKDAIYPNRMIAYIRNQDKGSIQVLASRLWLPKTKDTFRTLYPSPWQSELDRFPKDGRIASEAIGGFQQPFESLPLSYAVVEIQVRREGVLKADSLWSYLKIRVSSFDISGGWIASDIKGVNSLQIDAYLRMLKRLHINTGQIEEVGGFTDRPEVYSQFPIKRFNRMQALDRYDSDAMLPNIHAVEFMGEPQYGGGRPVPPQEVYDSLAPYQASRLSTSLTLSEERTWRYYAGLSDYPHYDAYRVIAPAADSWTKYDRWEGKSIRWGAPLETIGDMTRSLREQSRPKPIAYWSQGAHDGWGGFLSQRRTSPTPDELRSQAWHGLGNGIASLYWFNLSVKSLCKFPDLIVPIQRVDREIVLLKSILETGAPFEYRRLLQGDVPEWDVSSIVSPESMLLVANDLRYRIDAKQNVFEFDRRSTDVSFQLAPWITGSVSVFRVDADGTHDVVYRIEKGQIHVSDDIHVVGVYVATGDAKLRSELDRSLKEIRDGELALESDPDTNLESDLTSLKQRLEGTLR